MDIKQEDKLALMIALFCGIVILMAVTFAVE
jgi:hypothetical protein